MGSLYWLPSIPRVEAVCQWSTTAYVDPAAGSDWGPRVCHGTTQSNAYKTLQAALDSRNWKYAGQSITLYYKGSGNQSLNNANSTNDVELKPYGGVSTSTRFTISGDKKITVSGFHFNGSGGVTLNGNSDYVLIENNAFTTSGNSILVSGNNTVSILDNTFNSAFIFASANSGTLIVDSNDFRGAASKSYDGKNWFVVASQLTGDFYVLNSDARYNSGDFFYVEDSAQVHVADNEVVGGGVNSSAFQFNKSSGTYLIGNTIENVALGFVLEGDGTSRFLSIQNNKIFLVDDSSTRSAGVQAADYTLDAVSSNLVEGGDYAFDLEAVQVPQLEANLLASSVADIEARDSVTSTFQKNILTGKGINIHIVNGSFTDIQENAIWSPLYGIVLEASDGYFADWVEGNPPVNSPESFGNEGSIRSNDFYHSELAIGMAAYDVTQVLDNKFREVNEGIRLYFSDVDRFNENVLSHNTAIPTGNGFYSYFSVMEELRDNSFENFERGVVLDYYSLLSQDLAANRFTGGRTAVTVQDSELSGALLNNVFLGGDYAFQAAGTVSELNLINNTFYGQNLFSIDLAATLTTPAQVVNNVFSNFGNAALNANVWMDLGTYDSNLYEGVGRTIVHISGTPYDLEATQSVGYESAAYEEAASFVDAANGNLRLLAGSLAVNSADMQYAPPRDADFIVRPVCSISDRGAYEAFDTTAAGNLDADGDGLCAFQESVWGTDVNKADSDLDLLSDFEEIYEYGTLATNADTDGDAYSDGEEILRDLTDPLDPLSHLSDSDRDGMEDAWEIANGLDPFDASDANQDGDGDGLSNLEEYQNDTQPNNSDTDGDGLSDGDEVNVYFTDALNADTDGDDFEDGEEVNLGTDPLVQDTDGDGFSDYEEYLLGSDPLDSNSSPDTTDTDGDGLYDVLESLYGTDLNDSDTDDDLLNDYEEVMTYGTDPLLSDTDSDGLSDEEEVNTYGTDPLLGDTDSDGLGDEEELNTYGTDPLLSDTDSDLLNDYEELMTYGTDPLLSDTDSDGLSDEEEVNGSSTDPNDRDTDADVLSDGEEVNTYGTDPLLSDTDSDLLNDYEEVMTYGTNPSDADTDGDTYSDGQEVLQDGTDPLDSSDYFADADGDGMSDSWEGTYSCVDPLVADGTGDADGEGLSNLEEYYAGSHPCDTDTENDGLTDYEEVVTYGTNPRLEDSDADGLTDEYEVTAYFTDPNDEDSDGDAFTDGSEVYYYGTDPLNAANYPQSLTLSFVGYDEIYGYGSGTWTTGTYGPSSSLNTVLNFGDSYWVGTRNSGYGAFGVRRIEGFLGTVEVYDCGNSATPFDPISASCTSVPLFSATSNPDAQVTQVSDSADLEAWSTLSSFWTFAGWDWYRPAYTGANNYTGYKISLSR
ncbi:hypothetical protein IPG41_02215 [Candidatus Peregrinibacteria bacterium]|nr:MAG: hypothetical protein IPG41_02215 [Candidatus Peregrinibacteria bacterium]